MGPSLTTTYGNVEKVGYLSLTSKYWDFLAILVVACNFSQAYVWSNFILLSELEILPQALWENSTPCWSYKSDFQFLLKLICLIEYHANEYFSRNEIWVTWPWIIKYSKYIIHWQKVWSTLQHFLVNFLQKVNTTFHLWIGHNQARHYCINNENCVLQEELVTFSSTDYQPKILNSFLLYFSEVRVNFILLQKIK